MTSSIQLKYAVAAGVIPINQFFITIGRLHMFFVYSCEKCESNVY